MQRHIGISIMVFPKRMEPSETVYIHRNINRKPEFRTQDSRTFYFPEIRIYDFPVFRTFVVARPLSILFVRGLNDEPAQAVDVIIYGMQTGSESFSVHPCDESGNARNTVCDATH